MSVRITEIETADSTTLYSSGCCNTPARWKYDIKKGVLSDICSLPFFICWSILLSIALEYVPGENLNTFIGEAMNEGVGFKTIVTLLLASALLMSVGLLCKVKADGWIVRVLAAPARFGGSICMATCAVVIGTLPVLGITSCVAEVLSLIAEVIAPLLLFWAMFCMAEASLYGGWRSQEKYQPLARLVGITGSLVAIVVLVFFYFQILNGVFVMGSGVTNSLLCEAAGR